MKRLRRKSASISGRVAAGYSSPDDEIVEQFVGLFETAGVNSTAPSLTVRC